MLRIKKGIQDMDIKTKIETILTEVYFLGADHGDEAGEINWEDEYVDQLLELVEEEKKKERKQVIKKLTNNELVQLRKNTTDEELKVAIREEFKQRQLRLQDEGNGTSLHHMWSMPEIRNQLKKIHGSSWTTQQYQEETKKIHSMIPVYKITLKKHRQLHGHKSSLVELASTKK